MSYKDVKIIRSPSAAKAQLFERQGVYIVAIVNRQTKEIIKYDCCTDVFEFTEECRRVPNWFLPYKSKTPEYEVHQVCTYILEYDGITDIDVVLQQALQRFICLKCDYDQFMNHTIKSDGRAF